jgi:hypothetical protein
MTAWLADRGGMARPRAAATAARARKLVPLSLSPGLWRDGVLSSGQVDAIAANLDADTLGLFAAHEAAVVPSLVDLSPRDVTVAMRTWREAASPDGDPKPERPHALHLSRTLNDRWRTDGTLGPETGELLATALRLAQTRTMTVSRPVPPRPGGPMPWVMSAGSSWTTSRPGAAVATGRISTWCSTLSATSPTPPPALPPPTAPTSTGPPSTGCSATRRCTGCSRRGGRRSWTTAPPRERSRPRCSTRW